MKFRECLPDGVAVGMLESRLADPDSVAAILAEIERVVTTSDTDQPTPAPDGLS